jgi:S-formylglutathione hydrolase FrmB
VPDDARITRITVTESESPCTGPTVAFSTTAALRLAGGRVVAESIWSQSLGLRKELVVYLPPSYDLEKARRYPVVTLLHGLWGDQWQWVRSEHVASTMDSLITAGLPEMILVMPDGDDGWWTTWHRLVDFRGCRAEPLRRRFTPPTDPSSRESPDAYCVPWAKYDDYVARDLVAQVDSMYRTHANRSQRGIAGLSMGGYGAVTLALAYPEVFAAAASHSGALSPLYVGPRPFVAPARYASDLDELRRARGNLWWSLDVPFGDITGFRAREPAIMAERLVRRGRVRRPAIFMDVGVDDFLVDENRSFHHRLNDLGYAHEYTEWPGAHDHAYWRAHVRESLRWMAGQFASAASR